MIKGIIFDFNGVIIDDERVHMQAYQHVLKDHDIDLTEEEYFSCLGMDDKTFVGAAFTRSGKDIDAEKILEITTVKSEKWKDLVKDNLPLFPGIENTVAKLSEAFMLGIASMAKQHEIEYVLEQSGMRKHFAIIVSAADINKCKPDPECYRKAFGALDNARIAAGHLPMNHNECLAIEDSPQGVQAAISAGLQALGVTNTVNAEALRSAGARATAKDLNDWMPESIIRVFN